MVLTADSMNVWENCLETLLIFPILFCATSGTHSSQTQGLHSSAPMTHRKHMTSSTSFYVSTSPVLAYEPEPG